MGGPKITWGGYPPRQKAPRNRLHLDLQAVGDRDAEVERLVALGATRLDGEHVDGGVLLADPDGNEFCLLDPV